MQSPQLFSTAISLNRVTFCRCSQFLGSMDSPVIFITEHDSWFNYQDAGDHLKTSKDTV